MRPPYLVLVLLMVVGCDLLPENPSLLGRHELAGTAWKVRATSDGELLPGRTRFSFDADGRFTSNLYRCGRWRIEDSVLVIETPAREPRFVAVIEDLANNKLDLTLQPREHAPSVRVLMRTGPHPQEHFEEQARTIPDASVREDASGEYVTDSGRNWRVWKNSPLYNCGMYRLAGPWPNPTNGDSVTVTIGHVDLWARRELTAMFALDADQLVLKAYDDSDNLVTLDEAADRRMFTFDPARLAAPEPGGTTPRLYRLLVMNDREQIVAFGNLLVE